MTLPLRIVIAGEQARFMDGLRSLLHLHPDLDVVAQVEKLGKLRHELAETLSDVVLLYVDPVRGRSLLRQVAAELPVIAVMASGRREHGLAALRAGARGVLFRRFAIDQLVEAIRAVAGGGVWAPPGLQAELVERMTRPRSPASRLAPVAAATNGGGNGHNGLKAERRSRTRPAPPARRGKLPL
jgi:DNA-binding NarL/FixJ family response regulator